jgi:DNA-binding transcriptional MerR regulator
MKTLEDFMEKNKPKKRKSIIENFKDDVLILHKEGYSVEQIQEFLKINNLSTSIGNIYYFIKKQIDQADKKDSKNFSLKQKENVEEVLSDDEPLTIANMRRKLKERNKDK